MVPGECFLIADAAGPWEEFDTAIVVNAVGWSGLKDKESIQLLGPDFNLVVTLFISMTGGETRLKMVTACHAPAQRVVMP